MNQAKLRARVIAVLEGRAKANPLEWVPAEAVAAKLFGTAPHAGQMDVLLRVLSRLSYDDVIEVAQFRPSRRGGRLTTPWLWQADEQHVSLATTSGGLTPEKVEYGIRLRDGSDAPPTLG